MHESTMSLSEIAPVRDEILALPEEQRLVLALVYLEGLDAAQIAQLLDRSPEWVFQVYTVAVDRLEAHRAAGLAAAA